MIKLVKATARDNVTAKGTGIANITCASIISYTISTPRTNRGPHGYHELAEHSLVALVTLAGVLPDASAVSPTDIIIVALHVLASPLVNMAFHPDPIRVALTRVQIPTDPMSGTNCRIIRKYIITELRIYLITLIA